MPAVYWGPSAVAGVGVFARRALAVGDVIEVCPVLVVPAVELELLDQTTLYGRYYSWGDGTQGAVALGLGSLYNHADEPNATWVTDEATSTITYVACQPIATNEEVFICYADPEDLWFTPVATPQRKT